MEPRSIDVAILCGGRGTRLGAVSGDLPKPLVPIGGRPFLEILLEWVSGYGFERIILCSGYHASRIREYFQKQTSPKILFSEESEPLGTAGALKHAAPLLQSQRLLALNGDSYCPLDLHALLSFHKMQGGLASVAVAFHPATEEGGGVIFNDRREVIRFGEKKEGREGGYLNAGIYLMERTLLEKIPGKKFCSLEEDIFPLLKPGDFHAYVTTETFHDIGTPERLKNFRGWYRNEFRTGFAAYQSQRA